MSGPYYTDDRVTILHGDALDELRSLPDASVDSVVCDPPYDLTNRTPDVLGCVACGRTLGGRDGTPDVCPRCGGDLSRQRSAQRKGFMGKEWDGTGIAFRPDVWVECLRVLKPGGHLLAFGGTRTWHRLACAVEDAGFEVRDSIAWLYGSGFPKSMNVAKAITGTQMGHGGNSGAIRRATMGEDYESSGRRGNRDGAGRRDTGLNDHELPLTPDAERWQGWGTALKPAFEPVVVARKPLAGTGINVLGMVESGLRNQGVEGEIGWTTRPASDAASQSPMPTSGSTSQQPTAATSARIASDSGTPSTASATASATATPTANGDPQTPTKSRPTAEGPTGDSATPSSTPTAPTAPAAAKQSRRSSLSTISTAAAPSTESQSTERSTPNSAEKGSLTVTESFAGIATGLTGSWATVRIDRLEDGSFVWPDGLPRKTGGGGTVAANVLQHGTGALNVDACRVEGGARPLIISKSEDSTGILGNGLNGSTHGGSTTAGRWPTNVVLDDSQAAVLDEQSGERTSGKMMPTHTDAKRDVYGQNAAGGYTTMETYGDTGGASRFFPTFRYEAKAPATERPRVNGTAHPTVKPLDLMRWLVRLVTPPGGTVLEPFAGSGTTVEACIVEGFHCIAIEREADYLPLIMQRVNRRRDPVAYIKAAGDDLGLFDLEGLA